MGSRKKKCALAWACSLGNWTLSGPTTIGRQVKRYQVCCNRDSKYEWGGAWRGRWGSVVISIGREAGGGHVSRLVFLQSHTKLIELYDGCWSTRVRREDMPPGKTRSSIRWPAIVQPWSPAKSQP